MSSPSSTASSRYDCLAADLRGLRLELRLTSSLLSSLATLNVDSRLGTADNGGGAGVSSIVKSTISAGDRGGGCDGAVLEGGA